MGMRRLIDPSFPLGKKRGAAVAGMAGAAAAASGAAPTPAEQAHHTHDHDHKHDHKHDHGGHGHSNQMTFSKTEIKRVNWATIRGTLAPLGPAALEHPEQVCGGWLDMTGLKWNRGMVGGLFFFCGGGVW